MSISDFIDMHNMGKGKRHDIGFTFSFPMRKEGVASGVLLAWTKEFKVSGVLGKDVVRLLNKAILKSGLKSTRVIAIANDTVSTLVARSYKDRDCDVGVIIGTGTNACYSEKTSNIRKLRKNRVLPEEMIVNTEWGNFNKLGLTYYDRLVDKMSSNPGEQFLEKMISGMYLGEITRFVLADLIAKNAIFKNKKRPAFINPRNFHTRYLSDIENDDSASLSGIKRLLLKTGSESEYEDRKIIKEICMAVSSRAASLVAAAIAAIITKIDMDVHKKHTVAVDGSLYEKHPYFHDKIHSNLKAIFGDKASNIKLSLTKDASCAGAAIIAASNKSV